MKVLCVVPPRFHQVLPTLRDEICFQDVQYTPFPMRLARVAAMLKPRHDVRILDANAMGWSWEALEKEMAAAGPADVVLFKSAAGLIRHDMPVADLAKKLWPASLTVLVESVVSPIYPERFLKDFPNVDILTRGQPDEVAPPVVDALAEGRPWSEVCSIAYREGGRVAVTPDRPLDKKLDHLPFMAYELLPMDRYTISYLDGPMHEHAIPGIRIRTTKDCPYACPFCIIGSGPGRGYDKRMKFQEAGRAADELQHVVSTYGLRGVYFWDETFTINKPRSLAFCDELIQRKLNLTWRCLTRIDCLDAELADRMAAAGCRMIEFGVEAGDPQHRKLQHKNFPDEEVIRAVSDAKRAGIRVNCDMMVGMPWETREGLDRTVDLACRLPADNVHLTMAFPYPGTEFHQIAEKEDLIECADLYAQMLDTRVRVGHKGVVRCRAMTSRELQSAWEEVREKVNRTILRRSLTHPWDLAEAVANKGLLGSLKALPRAAKKLSGALAGA